MDTTTKIQETPTSTNTLPEQSAPGSLGVHASVSFGVSQGGPCIGKGVCKLQSSSSGTEVEFSVPSEINRGLLYFTFNLTVLRNNQPEQAQYFTDPSGVYQFDATYYLTDPVFQALGLYPNARITPQRANPVIVIEDTVIMIAAYEHDGQ